MLRQVSFSLCAWMVFAAGAAAFAQAPVGSAFVYQGRLTDNGVAANGTYDFQFRLYDLAAGGSQVGPILSANDLSVTAGVFSVALNFGSVYLGDDLFLQIAVRPGTSTGAYTPLTPRQELTATPFSHYALAPWITSGSNLYYNAGNVGIGDSSPVATLTVGAGDKFQVSGSNGDVTFTDATASVTFPATSGANAPMIQMFASGTLNEDRMVIGHSPAYPGWGLRYQDAEDMFVYTSGSNAALAVQLGSGRVGIGTDSPVATLDVAGTARADIIQIDGGSDLSENFKVLGAPEPGMLVEIDPAHPGALRIAQGVYNQRVAGIISGANGIRPGMRMGQDGSIADGDHPVALSGRVYCYADASNGPIEPGDLLTTSERPGYAMKVTNHGRAAGAIIGKAMTPLHEGTGYVLVLVNLH